MNFDEALERAHKKYPGMKQTEIAERLEEIRVKHSNLLDPSDHWAIHYWRDVRDLLRLIESQHATITSLQAELREAREKALEEAAVLVEAEYYPSHLTTTGVLIKRSEAIRALKQREVTSKKESEDG